MNMVSDKREWPQGSDPWRRSEKCLSVQPPVDRQGRSLHSEQ